MWSTAAGLLLLDSGLLFGPGVERPVIDRLSQLNRFVQRFYSAHERTHARAHTHTHSHTHKHTHTLQFIQRLADDV